MNKYTYIAILLIFLNSCQERKTSDPPRSFEDNIKLVIYDSSFFLRSKAIFVGTYPKYNDTMRDKEYTIGSKREIPKNDKSVFTFITKFENKENEFKFTNNYNADCIFVELNETNGNRIFLIFKLQEKSSMSEDELEKHKKTIKEYEESLYGTEKR